jgi:hypothetical protein
MMLQYIEEMKAAESPTYGKGSFHIVPVSGLIMSIFSRFENEINTVFELWEPVPKTEEVIPPVSAELNLDDAAPQPIPSRTNEQILANEGMGAAAQIWFQHMLTN